jgi:hypothetical protein
MTDMNASLSNAPAMLPAVTLIIEWENAIDVEDEWTGKAMSALARELASVEGRIAARPRVLYLYDKGAVAADAIDRTIDDIAPQLREVADIEVEATEGLTYYRLKNYGVSKATTDLCVMIDSDAAPQPDWLAALLAPFADPEVKVVGGVTVLGYEDFLSRTMALSWIFDLIDETEKSAKRRTIHVNNCAVRTDFFRAHPFPELTGAFKKQCVFWIKGLLADGHGYVRTADATAIHAPHPGYKFLAWRAWTSGMDGDFQAYHLDSKGKLRRFEIALRHYASKVIRAWRNIVKKGGRVGLPVWQRPAAIIVALAYFTTKFIAQAGSIVVRRYEPLPTPATLVAAT